MEILIAIGLLLIAASGMLAMLSGIFFSTGVGGGLQVASRLGQEKLERALVEPFDVIGGGGSACTGDVAYATGAASGSGPGDQVAYTRTCTAPLMAGTIDVKVVRVTVQFRDGQNRLHTVRLGGLRAR